MAENKKTIVVEQIGSPIRRPGVQRATLIGLGLNKMHKRRTLVDSPQVRGMVAKVSHLVRIVEDALGEPLDIGRKTRTLNAALKRALAARDECCRFPGCTHRYHLDAHHVNGKLCARLCIGCVNNCHGDRGADSVAVGARADVAARAPASRALRGRQRKRGLPVRNRPMQSTRAPPAERPKCLT